MNRYPCSGLVDGKLTGAYGGKCKHGFPVNPGCSPWPGRNGQWFHPMPACVNEELCARLWPDTGAPVQTDQQT